MDIQSRRGLLKAGAIGALAAPFVSNANAAAGQTWKVQSTWDAGTTGYTLFENWCKSIKEKTGGELTIQAFPAKSVAADNNALFEAVKSGVLQGMNPWTLYWAGKIPASVFLSSYPMGPDQPAQWDTMFYGLGMLKMAREIYAKHNMFFVGHIQHDANIIHSKVPITSLEEMKGKKIRLPGGMVSEVFQQFGVSTVALPGSDIFPALEKGTIDAADFVGPAVNYDLGFHQVTKYILMGPPGMMSIYQPVDLMDLTVNMGAWKRLSPKMQALIEEQVRIYSQDQYAAIQKANVVAMGKFAAAGSTVSRLKESDADKFRKAAIPIWFNWARKDADAARVFKLQLDYMKNGVLGYISDSDIKGQKL